MVRGPPAAVLGRQSRFFVLSINVFEFSAGRRADFGCARVGMQVWRDQMWMRGTSARLLYGTPRNT